MQFVKITVGIEKKLKKEAERVAVSEGITFNELANKALLEFLNSKQNSFNK